MMLSIFSCSDWPFIVHKYFVNECVQSETLRQALRDTIHSYSDSHCLIAMNDQQKLGVPRTNDCISNSLTLVNIAGV